MGRLPTQMTDHWWWRPGVRPGRHLLVWHILSDDEPQVKELARGCQERLRNIDGLDLVPLDWLHMTTLIVGHRDESDALSVDAMVSDVQESLSGLAPITVELGKPWLHAEGVTVSPRPMGVLSPIWERVHSATSRAVPDGDLPAEWWPHMSVAYSNSDGPADPVIQALRPPLPPVEWTVRAVHLVAQERVDHTYRWDRLATAALGGDP